MCVCDIFASSSFLIMLLSFFCFRNVFWDSIGLVFQIFPFVIIIMLVFTSVKMLMSSVLKNTFLLLKLFFAVLYFLFCSTSDMVRIGSIFKFYLDCLEIFKNI